MSGSHDELVHPVDPPTPPHFSAPHSHPPPSPQPASSTFTRVTSTNSLTATGQVRAAEGTATASATATASLFIPPGAAHTPSRHPHPAPVPTPVLLESAVLGGSLNWPSVHRSLSSTNAQRDSSRRSETAGDSLMQRTTSNTSSLTQESTSHTARNERRTRDDRRSWGQMRPPSAEAPTAPPLVDLTSDHHGEGGLSYPTTSACTPREEPTPPALAPLEEYEATAAAMTREELAEAVEQLRTGNRVLKTSVMRSREALTTLQEGMRESYTCAEKRQEYVTNTLMRRLHRVKERKEELLKHLRAAEQAKAQQEAKLKQTKRNIEKLSSHLRKEEDEIALRMKQQLQFQQAQREQLDRIMVQQCSSVQELEQLVNELQKITTEMDNEVATPATESRAGSAPRLQSGEHPLRSGSGGNTTTEHSAVESEVESTTSQQSSTHVTPGAAPVPPTHLQQQRPRSNSQLSVASSTTARDTAYDPKEMIRYLEHEINAVAAMQRDASERAERYDCTRERLEQRVEQERHNREAELHKVKGMQQELQDTSHAVNELNAAQEMAVEMESERRLNLARSEALSTVGSSGCVTPRGQHSRGPSYSPQQAIAAAAGPAEGGSAAQGTSAIARPHPIDAILAPTAAKFAGPTPEQIAATGASSGQFILHPTPRAQPETLPPGEEGPATRQHSTLRVQDTARMSAPRPLVPSEGTPQRSSVQPSESGASTPPSSSISQE